MDMLALAFNMRLALNTGAFFTNNDLLLITVQQAEDGRRSSNQPRSLQPSWRVWQKRRVSQPSLPYPALSVYNARHHCRLIFHAQKAVKDQGS